MSWNEMLTEKALAEAVDLDRKSVAEILSVMNREDRRVAYAVQKEIPRITRAVEVIVKSLSAGGRLFYVGAGSSGRLAALDAAECPPTFGVSEDLIQVVIAGGRKALWQAVESAEDRSRGAVRALKRRSFTCQDVMLGISASGVAPFVLGALDYARELGARTIVLSCNPNSPAVSRVALSIVPRVGPEVIAGSTRLKSGTAQKMVLNMISTAVMVKLGRVQGNLMVDLRGGSKKLRQRCRRIVQELAGVDDRRAEELLRKSGYSVRGALLLETSSGRRPSISRKKTG